MLIIYYVSLIISLFFTDYEESYYDYYYKDNSDYLENDLLGIGSEGTFIRAIRFQFQYLQACNNQFTSTYLSTCLTEKEDRGVN